MNDKSFPQKQENKNKFLIVSTVCKKTKESYTHARELFFHKAIFLCITNDAKKLLTDVMGKTKLIEQVFWIVIHK